MAESSGFPESLTRRGVVAAAGGAGLAAVLTACGSGSSSGDAAKDTASSSPSQPSTTEAGTPSTGTGTPTTEAGTSTTPAASGGGNGLAKTSDIPVGGGKVFADAGVVVTQPTAGQFKGFSSVCTHLGCTVADVSGGTINCHCHGSQFKVADGSVAHGPATAPLPAKQVSVSGGEITLG